MSVQDKLERLAAETQWQVDWYRNHYAAFEELAQHYGTHDGRLWPRARVHFTMRRLPTGGLILEDFSVVVEAGAPEANIEITPAMIDAGHTAFCKYDSRFEDIEEAVSRIYRAMARIKNVEP